VVVEVVEMQASVEVLVQASVEEVEEMQASVKVELHYLLVN
jgi:hypothetical protein